MGRDSLSTPLPSFTSREREPQGGHCPPYPFRDELREGKSNYTQHNVCSGSCTAYPSREGVMSRIRYKKVLAVITLLLAAFSLQGVHPARADPPRTSIEPLRVFMVGSVI